MSSAPATAVYPRTRRRQGGQPASAEHGSEQLPSKQKESPAWECVPYSSPLIVILHEIRQDPESRLLLRQQESESPFRTIPQHATKTIGLCSQDSPWNQDLSWKVDVYSLCRHSFSRHPLVDSNFEQACCEREQIQVSKFVFPDGIEGSIAGGAAAAEGHVGDLDKKRKESAKREEGGSEIGSLVGSSIR